MTAKFMEFRNKEIINLTNGVKVGYVDDILFDTDLAKITSLVVYGRARFFGLFGREEDLYIDWCDIEVIGEDTILIKNDGRFQATSKRAKTGWFHKLLG